MPRIYTSENCAVDFCLECFPSENTAMTNYDSGSYLSCFVYMGEHHDYDDCDYVCKKCGIKLTTRNGEK